MLSARISLHKQATPSIVSPGATVTFSLRVKNHRGLSAQGPGLRHPAAWPGHRLGPGILVSGRTLCASVGTLRVLAAKTLRFIARVGQARRRR